MKNVLDVCRKGRDLMNICYNNQLEKNDIETLADVGIIMEEDKKSGSFIMRDYEQLFVHSQIEGLEILPIADALDKYDWLRKKYYCKAVPHDKLEKLSQINDDIKPQGFFIHVHKGIKVRFPFNAAIYMSKENIHQNVHNVVILDDDTELHLITGCATQHSINSGTHLAISEQYIGKNSKLTSTMIHSWGSNVKVIPRSGTIVDEGGRFENNYICLRTAKDINSNPQTWLNGSGSSAKYLTIILCSEGSKINTGGDVYLNGQNTTAELAHRAVCTGGQINQTGLLIGNALCKAHVDCAGMLIDAGQDGYIESIPGLKALHPEAQMSHEASLGKIAPEQVEYLQSRGMDETEAISLLIRGFLGADVAGLGPELDARIAEIAELAGHGEE